MAHPHRRSPPLFGCTHACCPTAGDMHMYGSRKVFPLGSFHRTQLKSKVHLKKCLPLCSYRNFRFLSFLLASSPAAHRLHTLPPASVSPWWAAAGPRSTGLAGHPHLLNLALVCNCTPPLQSPWALCRLPTCNCVALLSSGPRYPVPLRNRVRHPTLPAAAPALLRPRLRLRRPALAHSQPPPHHAPQGMRRRTACSHATLAPQPTGWFGHRPQL